METHPSRRVEKIAGITLANIAALFLGGPFVYFTNNKHMSLYPVSSSSWPACDVSLRVSSYPVTVENSKSGVSSIWNLPPRCCQAFLSSKFNLETKGYFRIRSLRPTPYSCNFQLSKLEAGGHFCPRWGPSLPWPPGDSLCAFGEEGEVLGVADGSLHRKQAPVWCWQGPDTASPCSCFTFSSPAHSSTSPGGTDGTSPGAGLGRPLIH